MLLHGVAFPNTSSRKRRNVSRDGVSLLSDKDYDDLSWMKNDNGKYSPSFFPESFLNQLGNSGILHQLDHSRGVYISPPHLRAISERHIEMSQNKVSHFSVAPLVSRTGFPLAKVN